MILFIQHHIGGAEKLVTPYQKILELLLSQPVSLKFIILRGWAFIIEGPFMPQLFPEFPCLSFSHCSSEEVSHSGAFWRTARNCGEVSWLFYIFMWKYVGKFSKKEERMVVWIGRAR